MACNTSGVASKGSPERRQIIRQSSSQLLRTRRGVLLVHKIRKTQQLRRGVVERDVEVPRVHQLVHNAVHGGEKLLQIVGAAALLGDPVQRRTQRLHPPAVGNVVVSGVEALDLPIQHQRRARHGNVEQTSIFLSALRFKCDALPLRDRLGHPTRFRQTLRRHYQIFQRLSCNFRSFVSEHAHKRFIRPQHPVLTVGNAQPIGRRLKHLLQKLQPRFGARLRFPVWIGPLIGGLIE